MRSLSIQAVAAMLITSPVRQPVSPAAGLGPVAIESLKIQELPLVMIWLDMISKLDLLTVKGQIVLVIGNIESLTQQSLLINVIINGREPYKMSIH